MVGAEAAGSTGDSALTAALVLAPVGEPGGLTSATRSGLGSFSIGELEGLDPLECEDDTCTFTCGTTTNESRFTSEDLVMYLKGRAPS